MLLLNKDTKVIVQGITGNQGSFHTARMLEYGTRIVAGVAPGKGGGLVLDVPVYETVRSAMSQHQADASILFVPAAYAKDAAFEAIANGIRLLVVLTEHIPVRDTMEILAIARQHGTTVVGPNTFGLVASGASKIGIMPNRYFQPGPVGVISRSGTLCYQIVGGLLEAGFGTSHVIGLGGDRVVGLDFIDVLRALQDDAATRSIVLVGEIGGSSEEEAADFIRANSGKPVIAYLAGKSAPPGKRMGHAGAIIERGRGTFEGKVKALESAGVAVAGLPSEIPVLLRPWIDKAPAPVR